MTSEADRTTETEASERETRAEDVTTGDVPAVLAGRYELREIIGQGGSGVVRRTLDRALNQTVAVKSLRPGVVSPQPRIRREIAALRLLRLPGVVALRDEVEQDGAVHLVMDLVEGEHFPGADRAGDWNAVGPIVRALLETLGRVHATGVVHRDMKPSNVLVDGSGRATLVDFGLSYGPALGPAVTQTGTIVGTPEYLAPEQIRGKGIDGRTDLYSLGVMIYESLAGKLPVEASNFSELVHRKLSGSTTPLARLAPDVPRNVAQAVDRMLSVERSDRPQSAAEALRLMFGDGAPGAGDPELPLLGSQEHLERVLDAIRSRRSIDVYGPLGSGRSRLLQEAAAACGEASRTLHWAMPGRAPYESLSRILGDVSDLNRLSQNDAFDALDGRIRKALRAGAVLLVDDPKRVDQWSKKAIARLRDSGTIIRVVAEPTEGCVELTPLQPEDLRVLFAGPNRIFHLPEDGADELWRRTGGQPARVRSELLAWIRHGIAHWEDDKVAIDRAALNRLHGGLPVGGEILHGARSASLRSSELEELLAWVALAWPHSDFEVLATVSERPRWMLQPEVDVLVEEGMVRRLDDGRLLPLVMPEALQVWSEDRRRAAHKALGDALPGDAPERLRHLSDGAEPLQFIAATQTVCRKLVDSGKTGDALALLTHALDVARRENDTDACAGLLEDLVRATMSEGTPGAVNAALYEIDRTPGSDVESVATLRSFLLAVLETQRGDPEKALAMLNACPPFDDAFLELWRHANRMRASSRIGSEEQQAVLDEVGDWAERTNNERAKANHRTWTAHLLRAEGRYLEAAALFAEAAAEDERVPARMASMLNAGYCYVDGGDLVHGVEAARTARALAKECRHALYEAYAANQLRDIELRMCVAEAPDLELLDAVATIGSPELLATTAMTEAAIAWRNGDLETARRLAAQSSAVWIATGRSSSELNSRSLELASGAELTRDEVAHLLDLAASDDMSPFTAVSSLGLIACADTDHLERARRVARLALAKIPEHERGALRNVISVTEAVEHLGLD